MTRAPAPIRDRVRANDQGVAIREVLQRYGATEVGGEPAIGPRGAYIVSVPDPGPSYEAVASLREQLAAEPGVFLAYIETYRDKAVPRGALSE